MLRARVDSNIQRMTLDSRLVSEDYEALAVQLMRYIMSV